MDFDVIILAGGKSRRMGRDKAGIELGGMTLLERVVGNALTWEPKGILIAGSPREWLEGIYVADVPGYEPSSLLGVYSGVLASRAPWQLLVGCDMPFVKKELVEALWEKKNSGGAVALWNQRLQPLPGLVPKKSGEIIKDLLERKRYHLAALLDFLEPAQVSREQAKAIDPEGQSFFNINSPMDLDQAKVVLEKRT